MSHTPTELPDRYVAEFLDLATSAHVHFELVDDRLTMRAVNPHWEMWKPFRHLLDEIGARRIEQYLRDNHRPTTHSRQVGRLPHLRAARACS